MGMFFLIFINTMLTCQDFIGNIRRNFLPHHHWHAVPATDTEVDYMRIGKISYKGVAILFGTWLA